jgi:hypothetical protein
MFLKYCFIPVVLDGNFVSYYMAYISLVANIAIFTAVKTADRNCLCLFAVIRREQQTIE